MKMKKSTIALLVSALTCSAAINAILLGRTNKQKEQKNNNPTPFVINEGVEARDDVFGDGESSLYAGEIGLKQHLMSKRLNDVPENLALTKPKIGYQYAFSDADSDSNPDHISIRFTAAINSLNVESATWTRAMFKENGDVYPGLTEGNKGTTKAYTGLTNGGVVAYATSIEDDEGNHPYNYFVVYTLLDIPLDGYGKYYLDASLTLTKGDNSVTSTVGAVEVDTEDFFTYERGTLSALDFTEVNDRELSVKGKDDLSNVSYVEIPAYANDGNGRYPVVEVKEYGFLGTNITSLEIPSSITSVGDYAFSRCKNLLSVSVPSSITSVGRYLFKGCSSLISVNYDALTITGFSFDGCDSLESFTIGSHVKTIENHAFFNFTNNFALEYLFVPSTVEYVQNGAFDLMNNAVILIEAGTDMSGWDSRWYDDQRNGSCFYVTDVDSNFVFDKRISSDNNYEYFLINNKAIVTKYVGSDEDIVVPTTIDGHEILSFYNTFKNNGTIRNVTISEGITEISNGMFDNCFLLEKVVLPTTIETIGGSAFSSCSSLRVADLSVCQSLKTIGKMAFGNTLIEEVVLPHGLQRIEDQAFAPWLGKRIYIPETLTYMGYSVFFNCPELETIYFEGEAIPSSWNSYWNYDGYKVVLGYKY